MGSDAPSLERGEKIALTVIGLPVVVILTGYLSLTYFLNGAYIALLLYALWALLFGTVLGLFIMRTKIESGGPVPDDEREAIEQIARPYGVTFRDIWKLPAEDPWRKLTVTGMLPGRYDLFVNIDWFEQLPPLKRQVGILYTMEMTIRRKLFAKHYMLLFGIYTVYLAYYFASIGAPDPTSLWLDIAPEFLAALGVLLVVYHAYQEIYEIDQVIAAEFSPQAMTQLLQSKKAKSTQNAERSVALRWLIRWLTEKRIVKLDAMSDSTD